MSAGGGQFWIIIRNVVILIASVYFLISLFLFLFQSRLVFFPAREIALTPGNIGLAFEDVYFPAVDGIMLNGWYIPCDSARAAILFCHGNAGNISHRLDSIRLFNSLRLDVFIFDYRGFGRSPGKSGEKGTYNDADAAWTYLTETRNIDPERIVVFGRSLGGAVASNLAYERPVGGLIVESSFTSVVDLASEIYWFLPVRLLSRFNYNTLEKIKDIKCPKMIIHSVNDEMISFKHGRRIFDAAEKPKEFFELSGSHNEGFLVNSELYKSKVDSFLKQVLDSHK